MPLAHGILARLHASFEQVVKALSGLDEASSVYLEVLDTIPRTAVAIGEKYFFRVDNYLSVTVIVVEKEGLSLVKVIACGGRKGFLNPFDLCSSRDYAREVLSQLSRMLGSNYEVLSEVDYLDRSKSRQIY